MTLYRYRAVRRTGESVTGEREAASAAAVLDWLKAQDLLPLRAEPATGRSAGGVGRSGAALKGRRRALFTREMATLLGAGLQLDHALAMMRRLGGAPAEVALLTRIQERVQGGAAFGEALAAEPASFPPDYVAVVRAGEVGGALGAVLDRLADGLERAAEMRERLVSSLIYPAILVVAAMASIAILLLVVIPAFAPLFADAGRAMPPATQALLDIADATKVFGPFALLGLVIGGVGFGRLPRGHAARRAVDAVLLRVPVAASLITKLETARFARTLGTLVANGVPLLSALGLARATIASAPMADGIDRVAQAVRDGARLGDALAGERYWPRLAGELIRVGEETGRLPAMLLKLADIHQDETNRAFDRLLALVTPTVTLLLGLVVAGVLAALLQAILGVNDLAL